MTADELLAALQERGVKLVARVTKLHVDTPAGVLTSELRAALVQHKPVLLKRLASPTMSYPFAVYWASEKGWLLVRDVFNGSWHQVQARHCPRSWAHSATARKKQQRAQRLAAGPALGRSGH